jgi:hypothetical protein
MRTALIVSSAPLARLVDRARGYAADGRAGSTKKASLSDTYIRHAKLFDDNAAGASSDPPRRQAGGSAFH